MSNVSLIVFMCGILCAIFYSARYSALSHKSKQLKVSALLKASKQWYEASKVDKDPVDALVHACSSYSFLHAARSLMGDEEIEELFRHLTSFIEQVDRQRNLCVQWNKRYQDAKRVNASRAS